MMKRKANMALYIFRQRSRFRTVFTTASVACFVLITADYAQFIDLPKIAKIPLWVGMLFSVFRWAICEGLIKPAHQASHGGQAVANKSKPNLRDNNK
ncbi:hypothetical protein OIK40_08930 [Erythrobacter sp. sf7]|uniref:Uncharacterized protein n=1 Tax=Erythrobacter fulvus TaxID=2987523 RepID=A0ABT5JPP9_9SPHN|nr:hypothetical protein [Erythrobacter fulvus]MDC8754763.1 hypothetical protein [Erythrobacter fulvus]